MDLRKLENRAILLKEIETPENKDRKDRSFRATEIFNGRLRQYVVEYLESLFSKETVQNMPIQSGANLSKKIVTEKASIYKESPLRSFSNVSDEQEAVLNKIYNDMKADYTLSKANQFYCLQNQCLIQCYPVDGKLKLRVLQLHHFDCIPMKDDPTEMMAIVISSYDKQHKVNTKDSVSPLGPSGISRPQRNDISDQIDQRIADPDDKGPETFEVWTRQYVDDNGETIPSLNFIMNKEGEILSDDPLSPVSFLPFIDVSAYKDYAFFASEQDAVTDFCIEYNSLVSELAQGHRMQSYSQPFLKGPAELLPKQIQGGPNTTLILPSDPDLGEVSFGYAVPGGSVAHGIELAEQLLAQFLSCQGVDPKAVSQDSANRYASGIERLLASIERFDATRVDFSLFTEVEDKLFHMIHFWHNALQGTDVLSDKYKMPQLSDDVDMAVTFARPEGAQTMLDKVEMHSKLIDQGLGSRVTACMDIYDMTREQAEEYVSKIDDDEASGFAMMPEEQGEAEE